ncbi:MAG: hypothetical protein ACKOCW_09015 [Planctomycetaceae bacterium]
MDPADEIGVTAPAASGPTAAATTSPSMARSDRCFVYVKDILDRLLAGCRDYAALRWPALENLIQAV